jgi:hypothetical protein
MRGPKDRIGPEAMVPAGSLGPNRPSDWSHPFRLTHYPNAPALAQRAIFAYKFPMSRGKQPRHLTARAPARAELRLLSLGLLLRLSRP